MTIGGVQDLSNYVVRYAGNAILIALWAVSIVGNFVITTAGSGAFLGLTDIQWRWFVIIVGAATVLYQAAVHTPPLSAWPTKSRVQVENQVAEVRKAA